MKKFGNSEFAKKLSLFKLQNSKFNRVAKK